MPDAPVGRVPRFPIRWLMQYSASLPDWIDDEEWVPRGERQLYSLAKEGLYAVLDGLESDGTALLPAYVPGGVTWAALEAGYDVRYYPVADDLSLPVAEVIDRIEAVDPAVVVVVHYFGFVDDGFEEVVAASRRRNAVVVEDCARGLFSRDRHGELLGSTGDVALFSLHKTLPTPNGGLIVSRVGTPRLPDRNAREWTAIARSAALAIAGTTRLNVEPRPEVKRPADQGPETVAPQTPLREIGPVSRRALVRCRPAEVQSEREGRYRALRELLVANDRVSVVTPPVHDGASPFGVAALAESSVLRDRYLQQLHRQGLPCHVLTWPPVYRHAEMASFKDAETLRSRLFIVPIHQQLGPRALGRIAACLAERQPSEFTRSA